MKLAIISDIHGNLPALNAVMNSIKSKGADKIVCLGDIVGYGARPEECVELIRSESIPCVLGNHDQAVMENTDLSYFNPLAKQAAIWTQAQLSKESQKFLNNLKYTLEMDNVFFTHSSPHEPGSWWYLFKLSDALKSFSVFKQPVAFVGHTHHPIIFTNPDNDQRIINVGSVGQPRDRDNRACYGIYDISTQDFDWVRVVYPIEEAVDQILEAGLPPFLANRLSMGM